MVKVKQCEVCNSLLTWQEEVAGDIVCNFCHSQHEKGVVLDAIADYLKNKEVLDVSCTLRVLDSNEDAIALATLVSESKDVNMIYSCYKTIMYTWFSDKNVLVYGYLKGNKLIGAFTLEQGSSIAVSPLFYVGLTGDRKTIFQELLQKVIIELKSTTNLEELHVYSGKYSTKVLGLVQTFHTNAYQNKQWVCIVIK